MVPDAVSLTFLFVNPTDRSDTFRYFLNNVNPSYSTSQLNEFAKGLAALFPDLKLTNITARITGELSVPAM